MIKHIVMRVSLKIHEKVSNYTATNFVREAIEKATSEAKDNKMSHTEEVTVSVIEDRTIYQHD